jgi:carbon-monoxide dehydrogenase medium subunit
MKSPPIDLERPERLDEAVGLLAERDDAVALAGGQSLIPALALRELRARVLVDLTRLRELRGVEADGVLRVGAGEPMSDLEREPLVARDAPLLVHTLGTVGAVAIRSRATLGGSAAWADPTSQLPAAMIALDATFVTTRRRLAADAFFHGPRRTALERGEVIVAVELPRAEGAGFGLRHVRRTSITWPVVGCAATLGVRDGVVERVRIALYGSGERPVHAARAAELLAGAAPTPEAFAEAARLAAAEADPRSDERASGQYRRDVLPVLVRRALSDALGRA